MAALSAFHATNLAQYGIDPLIVAGTIRNELLHRERLDEIQDGIVKANPKGSENFSWRWSIGDAQLQRRHIERLVNAIDEHGKPKFWQLQHLRNHNSPASVPDSTDSALLVGAYFQDVAQRLEHNEDPIPWYDGAHNKEVKESMSKLWQSGDSGKRTEALIRSFNPGEGARHVQNVRLQIETIENSVGRLFE